MSSVVISNLNSDVVLTNNDFFPLVQSSSLTSYRVNFQTLSNFFELPQISCSWTSQSVSSSYALSASYPPYPKISCSWTSQSFSSSYSNTASWAPHAPQIYYTSLSWASNSFSSSYALTASWAPLPIQSFQATCSWVSQSFSSSYALTASWAPYTSYNTLFQYISPILITPQSWPLTYHYTGVYTHGIIINFMQTSPFAYQNPETSFLYVSSSVMNLFTVAGQGHGSQTSLFYVNLGSNGLLYLSGSPSSIVNPITASIIGYY